MVAAADGARDAYDEARQDAEARQKELRRQISEQEKEAKELRRTAEDQQQRASDAQAAIDEAEDIHTHPETTAALASGLAQSRSERAAHAEEVERLAQAEQEVRERTRSSRIRFMVAVASVVVVLVLMLAWTFIAR